MSSVDLVVPCLLLQAAAYAVARTAMVRLERRSAVAELRRDYPEFVDLARTFGQATSERPLSDAASVRRWIAVSHEAWEDMYVDSRLKRLVERVVRSG